MTSSARSSTTFRQTQSPCECCDREKQRLMVAQKRLDLQKENLVLDQRLLEEERKNFKKTIKLAFKSKSTLLEHEVRDLQLQVKTYREKEARWNQIKSESGTNAEIAAIECREDLNLKILELEKDLREAKRDRMALQAIHEKEKERWENGILKLVESESERLDNPSRSLKDELEIQRLCALVEKYEKESEGIRKEDQDLKYDESPQLPENASSPITKNPVQWEEFQKEWEIEKHQFESKIKNQTQIIDNYKLLLPRNQILLDQTLAKNKQLEQELKNLQCQSEIQDKRIAELEQEKASQKQEMLEHEETHDLVCVNDKPDDDYEEGTLMGEMDTISLGQNHNERHVDDSSSKILIPLDFTPEEISELSKKFVIEWEWVNDQSKLGGLYTGWLDLEGNPSGYGTLRIYDGGLYTGEWEKGRRNGKGVYSSSDGALYSGPWLKDKFQGRGVYISESDQVYTGDWIKGLRHGTGIETWENGARYTGHYEEDKRNSVGTYTYQDGRRFDGMYKDDQPSGSGIQTSPDGSVLFEGEWSVGEFVGS